MPENRSKRKKIKVLKNGPYLVTGGIPLAEGIMIIGEEGEPMGWGKGRLYPAAESYALCRCGGTKTPPFCDGTHIRIEFDGTETAGHEAYLAGTEKTEGPALDLTWSSKFCALARFCHCGGDAWTLTEHSDVPEKRDLAVRESCDCPSGALIAWDKKSGRAIEPDLEPSIDLVENRESGQSGPIWVKGGIPVESADGTVYEVRNRVTLCRCGASEKKPFCDGSHISCAYKSSR
jgi:CDGSH-type Zn-finger protein